MAGRDISDRIQPTPTLGYFYTIQEGDTLLGVAGRASGASPGAERLEAARIINDAGYNDRFRGAPSKLFPKGQVSFSPRFTAEPNAQAAVDGPAPAGHKFATLWLAAYPGHELLIIGRTQMRSAGSRCTVSPLARRPWNGILNEIVTMRFTNSTCQR